MEIVVAVGHGKRDPRIHNRLQERLDGSADLVGRLGHEFVDARRFGIGEHRRRGMAVVLQTVGHPFGQLGRFGVPALDAVDAGLDFGDEPHSCAGFLAAAAQEGVDVCRVVAADLVAGEHHQIRLGLTDRGLDETDGVPVDLGLVLDVGHLQHAERAILVESQRHGSTVSGFQRSRMASSRL